ncbi:2-acylglycerol O-acyltransferase 1-like [Bradysia coprophila]|uniref:2-acylglycerol O-acyltransferase 1-like n=1 Tax=Bradysia coprophila TaxID=38358 RepID=UPI00187DB2DE|nr:2-acylglycerol O-acyltransferase 1-like [Bradysia coprophila]XP_037029124.1 2-acylglycerol O-acyltransferase 1-like [Bradysia coprophila]
MTHFYEDLQRITIGTLTFLTIFFVFVGSGPILIVFLIVGNTYIKAVILLYVVWYIFECVQNVTDQGGRRTCQWVRNWGLWKWFLNYFPVNLVKTADLPPDRNYLVCIFPHGWLSIGAFLIFASNHSKWSTLFPGIRPRFTTLGMNYYLPIYRELLLGLGMSSASAKSLTHILRHSNDPHQNLNLDGLTSNAAGLIVGGVREQRLTDHDSYKFVLKTRKGFVRIALKTGASLVPAISFGENNTFEQNSWKILSFRGRVPINTVVGAPIHVEENISPTEEEVSEVHTLFCKQIRELFEEHKSKYVENSEHVMLEFV